MSNKSILNHTNIEATHKIFYVFKHNIIRVWDLISDAYNMAKCISEISSLKFTKGSSSRHVGDEFNFKWKNMVTLYFRVEEVIDEENFKLTHVKMLKSEPSKGLTYDYICKFYRVTLDKNTLFSWEYIYPLKQFMEISPRQREFLKMEKKSLIPKLKDYLNKNIENLFQSESIIIKSNVKKLWHVISNWNYFRIVVPQLCDECTYDGDPNQVGSSILLKWESNNKQCKMKINKFSFDEENEIYEYSLISEEDSKIPKQEHFFKLVTIAKDQTLLIFKHIFLEPVNSNTIEQVSLYKQNILEKVKHSVKEINLMSE